MRILVTGAAGQLGLSLEKVAKKYPQHAFVFTDLPDADITDRDGMEALTERHDPELIINCAAYTAVDKAEDNRPAAQLINTVGPQILGLVAKKREIPVIHVSTDYVFFGEDPHPIRETHLPNPSSVYGQTKLAGETALEATGCKAAVVRTGWLYSEFGNNFVKTMLRLGGERDTLRVVYDQTGTPTYAPDLAEALLAIAGHGITRFERYHYGNEGVTSWYDFARTIFELSGMNVQVEPIESHEFQAKAPRPAYSVLSKAKIKSLGVQVPHWKDSLKICLEALKNHTS